MKTGMVALPPRAQADPPQVQDDPLAPAAHPRRSREDQAHRPRCAAQRAGSVAPTSLLPCQHHQVQDQHQHCHPRNMKVIIPKTILQFKKSYRMGFK